MLVETVVKPSGSRRLTIKVFLDSDVIVEREYSMEALHMLNEYFDKLDEGIKQVFKDAHDFLGVEACENDNTAAKEIIQFLELDKE